MLYLLQGIIAIVFSFAFAQHATVLAELDDRIKKLEQKLEDYENPK